jgi:hypothetical protein
MEIQEKLLLRFTDFYFDLFLTLPHKRAKFGRKMPHFGQKVPNAVTVLENTSKYIAIVL